MYIYIYIYPGTRILGRAPRLFTLCPDGTDEKFPVSEPWCV